MAKYVPNPAWLPAFNREVQTKLTIRAEAMAKDAQSLARGKSKRWSGQIAANPGRRTGVQSFRAEVGLKSWKEAWPGGLKEKGTAARTQKKTGRYTGSMPADPVFVVVADRWGSVPFTLDL